MGRSKGYKLSDKQKAANKLKRLDKSKKLENIITTNKKKSTEPLVAGYGFGNNDDHPVPIFSSEINTFKGRMFRTLDKATRKFNEHREE